MDVHPPKYSKIGFDTSPFGNHSSRPRFLAAHVPILNGSLPTSCLHLLTINRAKILQNAAAQVISWLLNPSNHIDICIHIFIPYIYIYTYFIHIFIHIYINRYIYIYIHSSIAVSTIHLKFTQPTIRRDKLVFFSAGGHGRSQRRAGKCV